jgi:N-acetylneuraminate synthase/N,N'-diacetyllegionaminate synthase
VVCSTDHPAIAAAAKEWGAEIPFTRPVELATDEATTLDVVLHCLAALQPDSFDCVILLQATSPLTEAADVLGVMRLHQTTGAPVISVCALEHPVAWQFGLDSEGRILRPAGQAVPTRRQDTETHYRPNGAIYVATPVQIQAQRGFVGPTARGFVMPAERSVDIDAPGDLLVAEALLGAGAVRAVDMGSRRIGPGEPCFVIAEAGVNHNGDLAMAHRLVDAAKAAGADAVKFQTFKSEKVIAASAPKAEYQARQTGSEQSQLEMVKALELSYTDFRDLRDYCHRQGVLFLSTPFEEESADFLDELAVPLFKVPSGELTNLPFLVHLARKGRPLIVSTGMATLGEVAVALDCIRRHGNPPVVLLQCVSNYPAAPANVNLRAMETMAHAFHVPVGYSDHTLGCEVAFAAVALGASVIEKHFTLDRNLPGPDHQASLEPGQLAELVRGIRTVESSLGSGRKEPAASEADTAAVARKSLVAARALKKGTVLTSDMVAIKRPGTGLAPALLPQVIGRSVRQDVAADTLLTWELLQ